MYHSTEQKEEVNREKYEEVDSACNLALANNTNTPNTTNTTNEELNAQIRQSSHEEQEEIHQTHEEIAKEIRENVNKQFESQEKENEEEQEPEQTEEQKEEKDESEKEFQHESQQMSEKEPEQYNHNHESTFSEPQIEANENHELQQTTIPQEISTTHKVSPISPYNVQAFSEKYEIEPNVPPHLSYTNNLPLYQQQQHEQQRLENKAELEDLQKKSKVLKEQLEESERLDREINEDHYGKKFAIAGLVAVGCLGACVLGKINKRYAAGVGIVSFLGGFFGQML